MQLNNLKRKTKRVRSKPVGRGGTRGKTSGRGTKGQNARAGRKKRPELRDFIKRFPKLRGRGVSSFKSLGIKPTVVNLSLIEKEFNAGDSVNPTTLREKKLVPQKITNKIKILGTGDFSKKLKFESVEISDSARSKIEKAGSTIA